VRNRGPSFLVINPFGIGDVLFSTPLIRNLKDNFPQSEFYYLCNKRAEPIIKNYPLINKSFVYERDEFEAVRKRSKLQWFSKYLKFISDIRKERIDISIDLSLNSQFGFLARAWGIRERLGLDYKGRGRFLTKKVKIEGFEDKHVAEYYLDLLGLLRLSPESYPMEVYTDKESKLWVDNFIEQNRISNKDLIIGVAPCGGEAFGDKAYVKRWPPDKFSLLIRRLIDDYKAKIFIFAGPKEKKETFDILSKIESKKACFEFTGCSLNKIIALVDRCNLVVANDTGPLRFANALGKKIIALFGPVDDKVYGLYPNDPLKHNVIKKDLACRPCYKKFRLPDCPYNRKCLNDITVDEVFNAVASLLQNKN